MPTLRKKAQEGTKVVTGAEKKTLFFNQKVHIATLVVHTSKVHTVPKLNKFKWTCPFTFLHLLIFNF